MNEKTMTAFGLLRGVAHSEFIRGRDDGKLYFLETSARVGGAHIVDLIEAATGVNMWAEWAKIEIAGGQSAVHAAHAEERRGRADGLAGASRNVRTPRRTTIRKLSGG